MTVMGTSGASSPGFRLLLRRGAGTNEDGPSGGMAAAAWAEGKTGIQSNHRAAFRRGGWQLSISHQAAASTSTNQASKRRRACGGSGGGVAIPGVVTAWLAATTPSLYLYSFRHDDNHYWRQSFGSISKTWHPLAPRAPP